MVRVSGPLVNVTTSSASVRDVQVHTKKVRAWGDGLMTPDPSQATLSNGVVEFEAAPGPVVMVLFMAEAGAETVSLVVGGGATQSLADAYRDGQMADDRDAGELAGILEQIRESVGASAEARAGAEAAAVDAAGSAESAGRDADRAETAEAGAVEARGGSEAGQELSEDAAAVAVAAAIGLEDAMDGVRYARSESLPAGTDLNDLWRSSDAGIHRLHMGRDYLNLPSDLPRTTFATLEVKSTGTSGGQYITQVSNEKIWYRPMTNSYSTPRGWGAWRRIEGDPAALRAVQDELQLTFHRHGTLPEGQDLNGLNGRYDNAIYNLGNHGNYLNLPSTWSPNVPGAIVVFSTGLGDTWQRAWQRFDSSSWTRQEVSPGSFTEWERVRYGGGDAPEVPATIHGGPQTTWEQAGILTSLEEGQAYQRWLSDRQPLVELAEIGRSYQDRPIHSLTIGDRTKPALFIMCAQHGDEIAGREAALIWARTISELRPSFLDSICVVIVPSVNVDKLNIRRLSASGTDLNGGWEGRNTREVQAVWSAIQDYDTRAVIDGHEGGNWTDAQIVGALSPEISADVRAKSDALMSAVWADLDAKDIPVSEYPGSEKLTNSRNRIPYELGIPVLLVETPNKLARPGWNGPGPDPYIYQPSLSMRVDMYTAIYEAAAKHVANSAV